MSIPSSSFLGTVSFSCFFFSSFIFFCRRAIWRAGSFRAFTSFSIWDSILSSCLMAESFRERAIICERIRFEEDASSLSSKSKMEPRRGTTTSIVQSCSARTNCSSPVVTCSGNSLSRTSALHSDSTDPAACNLVTSENCLLMIAFVRSVTAKLTEGVAAAVLFSKEAAAVPTRMKFITDALSSNSECSAREAFAAASEIVPPPFSCKILLLILLLPVLPPMAVVDNNCSESSASGSTSSSWEKAPAPDRAAAWGQFSTSPASARRERDRRDHCSSRDSQRLSTALASSGLRLTLADFPFLPPPFLTDFFLQPLPAQLQSLVICCPMVRIVPRLICIRLSKMGTITSDATSRSFPLISSVPPSPPPQ
mmetsp:Transcript_34670/g.73867  ORF Transcript_34670/g.73867 Transcript_34670/m.73867 type:complete len:367 (+) Transcript_34670:1424-2524(+)